MPEAKPVLVTLGKSDGGSDPVHLAARDAFAALFSEWLVNRAAPEDPGQLSRFEDDAFSNAHFARGRELARLVTAAPAVVDWHIWQKIEVLGHHLCDDGEASPAAAEALVMLAGIKAHLLQFGIGAERPPG